jgi:hypothetical protein
MPKVYHRVCKNIEASFLVQINVDSTGLRKKKTSALKCGTLINVEWITEGKKL